MGDYHPDRELAPRDVVARAIHQEMTRAGSAHVWLDITHLPRELAERRFPTILRFCRDRGVDPTREPIPVAPAAHYLMGGVRTDTWGHTSLPGLLACGEVACTGVHGANRLASNSLLEGLVFARRAVQSLVAGPSSKERDAPQGTADAGDRLLLQDVLDPVALERIPPKDMRSELAEVMWREASVVRSAASLRVAREWIARNAQPWDVAWNGDRAELESANLMLLSSLLLQSALLREESRGAHFRADFPQRDPGWRGHIVVSLNETRFAPLARQPEPVAHG
jgi:L-aspartate oxidase